MILTIPNERKCYFQITFFFILSWPPYDDDPRKSIKLRIKNKRDGQLSLSLVMVRTYGQHIGEIKFNNNNNNNKYWKVDDRPRINRMDHIFIFEKEKNHGMTTTMHSKRSLFLLLNVQLKAHILRAYGRKKKSEEDFAVASWEKVWPV